MSSTILPSRLLKTGLVLDAAASGAMGLMLTLGAGPLGGLLGLPQPLLLGVGAVCLGWAAVTFWLGRRERLAPAAVWAVIGLNALWVAESALLLLSGWVSPTGLGTAFVIAQALAVAGFAEMQFVGLRRSEPARLAAA
jgi:hypothetical protein